MTSAHSIPRRELRPGIKRYADGDSTPAWDVYLDGRLVANDAIAFTGPLYRLVDSETSSRLTSLHRQGLWLVVALVALHLAALLFYRLVRGENLVEAMLHGRRRVTADKPVKPASGGSLPALIVALAFAAGAIWAANGSWIPAPPPPAQSAPAW